MADIREVLGPAGIMAGALEGFHYRQQQEEMAKAVLQTLEQGSVLVAEAGTGTGKTFAYLVPAILSGRKVIISTGTKNLQDQLFLRDLPRVREALASPAKVALLKGRANYLCPYRLENALSDARGFPREVARQLAKVRKWSTVTKSGDIAELKDIPEDTQLWPIITSTGDNCLGQECPSLDECFLAEARKKAQESDLVVVNHHLLCADFSIKDVGFGQLLPEADAFVIDEAHQLPETASNFFGQSFSTRQVLELAEDTLAEYFKDAGDLPEITQRLDSMKKAARDLRLAFGEKERRGAWADIQGDAGITEALAHMQSELDGLAALLDSIKGRAKGLDSCLERTLEQKVLLASLCQQASTENIRWFEVMPQSLRLNSTPLEVSSIFRERMADRNCAWIFTSATLAVGESFAHFQAQLGLEDARAERWDSPFDYQNQALWFVPKGLPLPSDPAYTQAVMEIALPLIEASKGRAFLLCTSHRALKQVAEYLEDRIDFPLLVQGDAPKSELLRQFVEKGNAVLVGTSSFWEGVDVRGEALSMVIIDKLPFASPGDPVLQARLDAMKKQGGNPFMDYQVPQAAIALKQGAGRLIRDEKDRGLLVICDPRLLKKSYGHVFLAAMPDFARTRELGEAVAFISSN